MSSAGAQALTSLACSVAFPFLQQMGTCPRIFLLRAVMVSCVPIPFTQQRNSFLCLFVHSLA